VDVGLTSQYVRLVHTIGQKGNYIALSHCWGSTNLIRTTTRTLSTHEEGILITDLPKTFRDAISICRYLKVQFLWIDSLCIIQDDEQDWEREASRMADVYANAYLTIAASAAGM
jgi:hypothetical protein